MLTDKAVLKARACAHTSRAKDCVPCAHRNCDVQQMLNLGYIAGLRAVIGWWWGWVCEVSGLGLKDGKAVLLVV